MAEREDAQNTNPGGGHNLRGSTEGSLLVEDPDYSGSGAVGQFSVGTHLACS